VTKAVIYRPGSESHIVAAFTSAIAIHLSAVALASLHHELPSVISADEFGEIQAIEPGTPQSLPPADENPIRAVRIECVFRVFGT
jgi:hypothetical protein